jgi:hypothetical protein
MLEWLRLASVVNEFTTKRISGCAIDLTVQVSIVEERMKYN